MKTLGLALTAVLLTAAAQPASETRTQQYFRLRTEGLAAAKAGDLATAEARLEAALALYPAVPGSLIRLARVEAAAGKPDEALAHVADYARMGMLLDVAGDPALAGLMTRADYTPIAALFADNAKPTGRMAAEYVFREPDVLAEGVAFDGELWLVSAVNQRLVTMFNPSQIGVVPGGWTDADGEDGGLFGMAFDAMRNVVWTVEARGEGLPGSSGKAETALLELARENLDVLARYPIPEDGEKHQVGDVTVGPEGTVYVSDAVGGVIYRLKPGAKALEVLVPAGAMASPQGMAVCPGGKALVVADYSTGLHRIDLATGRDEPVGGLKAGLAGTDGLFLIEHDFNTRQASPLPVAMIATQNGVTPERVMFLRLSYDCSELEGASVLAANLPNMQDITLGGVGKGEIAIVAGSGWANHDGDGKRVGLQRWYPRLMFFPLP